MSKKIYVGNMNYNTTEDSVRDLFSNYGEVLSVNMITDRYTGRFKGFAFIEMETDDEANNAINSINGQELDGRELRVAEARNRDSRDSHSRRRYSSY